MSNRAQKGKIDGDEIRSENLEGLGNVEFLVKEWGKDRRKTIVSVRTIVGQGANGYITEVVWNEIGDLDSII